MNKKQFRLNVSFAMMTHAVFELPTGLEVVPYDAPEERITWKEGEFDWVMVKQGREFRVSVNNWERGTGTRKKDRISWACFVYHADNKPRDARVPRGSPYAFTTAQSKFAF